jgi:hypothetical protein
VSQHPINENSGIDEIIAAMRGELTTRQRSMIGLAPDTKLLIQRVIELSPVLEDAVLLIADLAYRDGADSNA